MPFALLIFGALLLVAGVRGTASQLYSLLKGDFIDGFASTSFVAWVVAILAIGGVGYVKKLQPISDTMLLLLVVVLGLKNGRGFFDPSSGFFAQLMHPARVGATTNGTVSSGTGAFVNTPAQQFDFINSLGNTNYNLNLGGSSINYSYPAFNASQQNSVPQAPTNYGNGYQYPSYQLP